jgi:hypothetical protein
VAAGYMRFLAVLILTCLAHGIMAGPSLSPEPVITDVWHAADNDGSALPVSTPSAGPVAVHRTPLNFLENGSSSTVSEETPAALTPTPSAWPSLGLTPQEIATIPSATPAVLDTISTAAVPSLSGDKWTAPPSQTLEEVFARRVHPPATVPARVSTKARTAARTTPGRKLAAAATPAPKRSAPGIVVRPLPTPPRFKQAR